MAVFADRVKETTTTTGTGTLNLAGAVSGYQTFVSGVGSGASVYYCITDASGNWEVGQGTVTDATPDTLSRATIWSSSNSGSAVSFGAGSKDVFLVAPAALFGAATTIDAPPPVPNAADDEFDVTPTLWTWQNQGSASYTVADSRLKVSLPANSGNNFRHLSQTLPGSGTWEYRAKFFARADKAVECYWGLGLRLSSNFTYVGKCNSGGSYYNPIVQKWTSNSAWSTNPMSSTGAYGGLLAPMYASVAYDATDLIYSVSDTGVEGSYGVLFREPPATFFGAVPDQVVLSANVNNATYGLDVFFEWFRRTA